MTRYLYRAVPSGSSLSASAESLEDQVLESDTEFNVGNVLPLKPGTWTVERVEQTGTTVWASEALRSVEAPDRAVTRTLHCRVEF